MFKAELVALADGQSYQDVRMYEDHEIDQNGIPRIFEDWTCCFIIGGDMIIAHQWKIKVIKLFNHRILPGPNSIKIQRLVIDGDIIYQNANLISHCQYAEKSIPHYFIKRDGIAGQMAFTCDGGTFITQDTNICSLVFEHFEPTRCLTNCQSLCEPSVNKQGTTHVKIQRNKLG